MAIAPVIPEEVCYFHFLKIEEFLIIEQAIVKEYNSLPISSNLSYKHPA